MPFSSALTIYPIVPILGSDRVCRAPQDDRLSWVNTSYLIVSSSGIAVLPSRADLDDECARTSELVKFDLRGPTIDF